MRDSVICACAILTSVIVASIAQACGSDGSTATDGDGGTGTSSSGGSSSGRFLPPGTPPNPISDAGECFGPYECFQAPWNAAANCANGGTTTLTGTVTDPAGKV